MRLSDILKKIQQSTSAELEKQKTSELKKITYTQAKEETSSSQKISLDVDKIYSESIQSLRKVLNEVKSSDEVDVESLIKLSKDILKAVKYTVNEILLYSCYSTVESYIYAHSVNVAIYSGVIANAKNLTEKETEEIILCGFLHDIGMIKYLEIAHKPYKLSDSEYKEIKKHSEVAVQYINKLKLPYETKSKLLKVIPQVHERCDGSGYPKGLKSDQIDMFAKIISIADVYEAMTHPRAYRDRILPHEAVVSLVKQAQTELDSQLVKIFVDRISIFPVGSYVKLNTAEIARVVATNPSFPVRPKVKVILTADNQPVKNSEIINLAEISSITIVEPVDETKITTTDKKLILQLKAQRWWVR